MSTESSVKNIEYNNQSHVSNDVLELDELIIILWRCKWFIAILSTAFLLLSIFYAINQPNIYRSEALIIPTEQEKY